MEGIRIPADQVARLDTLARGVRGLRIVFVNVFAVDHPDGSWTLVDTALPMSGEPIRGWAERRSGRPPNCIVLTHGHFDHVSSARMLADLWHVPVYAHPLEFPYLTGKRRYAAPALSPGGGLMTLLSPLYPRGPVDLGERLRELPAALAEMPGWHIVPTPGHTPGHVSLYRPGDKLLLAGDAFCTTKPESFFDAAVAQTRELRGPPAYFTSDWDAARDSVRRLAALGPEILAPGHGRAVAGPSVPGALRALARAFDQVALREGQEAA